MGFEFKTDEDTERLFEIVVHFLTLYFGYSPEESYGLVNRYYKMRESRADDDYYHHEGAFHTAVEIYYLIGLGNDVSQFSKWKKEHNLINVPKEAIDYFREHYFKK